MFQRLSALHKSLRAAAVYLVKGGCKERGWLCHGVCTPARVGCTVYQVDLFTVREKEANCLATRLKIQDNSLPVVLENYSSEGVFTRRPLLILVTLFRATCSIKANNDLRDQGFVAGTCGCVCVCLCD